MSHKLVRIGRVQSGRTGALMLAPSSTTLYPDVYTTERRQRNGGFRHAHSPAYDPNDVGEMEMRWGPRDDEERGALARSQDASQWAEKEIVPGLRIRVRRGRPWTAERLDSGQILLSPAKPDRPQPRGRRVEAVEESGMVGALFRDTDGFESVENDPRPAPGRGSRW